MTTLFGSKKRRFLLEKHPTLLQKAAIALSGVHCIYTKKRCYNESVGKKAKIGINRVILPT